MSSWLTSSSGFPEPRWVQPHLPTSAVFMFLCFSAATSLLFESHRERELGGAHSQALPGGLAERCGSQKRGEGVSHPFSTLCDGVPQSLHVSVCFPRDFFFRTFILSGVSFGFSRGGEQIPVLVPS